MAVQDYIDEVARRLGPEWEVYGPSPLLPVPTTSSVAVTSPQRRTYSHNISNGHTAAMGAMWAAECLLKNHTAEWRERAPGVYEMRVLLADGPECARGIYQVPADIPPDAVWKGAATGPSLNKTVMDAYKRMAQRQLDAIDEQRRDGSIPPHGEWSSTCACGARATHTGDASESKAATRYVCSLGHSWTDGGAPLCRWCFAACYRDHYTKTWECEAHGRQE